MLFRSDISSYDEIGKIYYSKKDYLNAVHYFELGTNYFEPNAIYHLAICYSKGEGAHLDLQKAINLYEIGISKGHARCAYNLAFLYKNGLGVKIDDEKYENLMRKYQELLHNTKI